MKLVQQLDTNDCGMACALMILHHFAKTGLSLTEFKVKHHYARNELSFYELEKLLTSYQLEVEGYYLETFGDLSGLVYPVLVDVKREGGDNHYVVLDKQKSGTFLVFDPDCVRAQVVGEQDLKQVMNGNVLVFQNNQKSMGVAPDCFRVGQKIGLQLLTANWLSYLVANLFDFLATLSLLFSSMFIKIMITNYLFLSPNQVVKVAFIIGCLIVGWMVLSGLNLWLKQHLTTRDARNYLHNLSIRSQSLQPWVQTNHCDFIFNQIQQSLNFRKALHQLFVSVLSLVGFLVFISVVLITFSKTFFFSTCLLVFLMIIIKGVKVRYLYTLSCSERVFSNHQQELLHTIIRDYSTIIKKTHLERYYDLKKTTNKKLIQSSGWTLIFHTFEKIIILGFYVLMFLTLDFRMLDLASFLIFTNLILLYNLQIDRFLSVLLLAKVSRPLAMVFHSNPVVDEKKVVITLNNQQVKRRYLIISSAEQKHLLIDYQPLKVYLETNQIYQTMQAILTNELTSNNLFNFGSTANLRLFQSLKMQTYCEKYAIDLTINIDRLNFQQKQVVAILSACFCSQKIILINKVALAEYEEIKQQLIENLNDRILIFVED